MTPLYRPRSGRNKRMGLTRLGEVPPRPIGGVVQRRILIDPDRPLGPQLPARCDKCGNQVLEVNGREVYCRGAWGGCGRTWYLVAGVPLVRLEIPSARTRYRQRAAARSA